VSFRGWFWTAYLSFVLAGYVVVGWLLFGA
jgi:hypothetical protein